jgi:hypothetical protein
MDRYLAEFRSVGSDDVEMDCRTCLIEVTFTGAAASVECESPERTLEYIRGLMRLGIERPVVASVDMRR